MNKLFKTKPAIQSIRHFASGVKVDSILKDGEYISSATAQPDLSHKVSQAQILKGKSSIDQSFNSFTQKFGINVKSDTHTIEATTVDTSETDAMEAAVAEYLHELQ